MDLQIKYSIVIFPCNFSNPLIEKYDNKKDRLRL